MTCNVAPQRHCKRPAEVRNVAVSFAGMLSADELLIGTPTITASPSGINTTNIAVSATQLLIDDQAIPAGQAIQFSVNSGTNGVRYTLTLHCVTNSTPAETVEAQILLDVSN